VAKSLLSKIFFLMGGFRLSGEKERETHWTLIDEHRTKVAVHVPHLTSVSSPHPPFTPLTLQHTTKAKAVPCTSPPPSYALAAHSKWISS